MKKINFYVNIGMVFVAGVLLGMSKYDISDLPMAVVMTLVAISSVIEIWKAVKDEKDN